MAVKNIVLEKVEGQNSDLSGSVVCIVVTVIIMLLLVTDLREAATPSRYNIKKFPYSRARRCRKKDLVHLI